MYVLSVASTVDDANEQNIGDEYAKAEEQNEESLHNVHEGGGSGQPISGHAGRVPWMRAATVVQRGWHQPRHLLLHHCNMFNNTT
jgi:hypothetical protein